MVGGVVTACHLLRVSGRSPDTFTAPKSNYIGNLTEEIGLSLYLHLFLIIFTGHHYVGA